MDYNTTASQIGRQTLSLINARNYSYNNQNGEFAFSVGRKRKTLQKVIITLDPSDTYTVKACTVNMNANSEQFGEVAWTYEMEGVYSDMMADVVKSAAESTC